MRSLWAVDIVVIVLVGGLSCISIGQLDFLRFPQSWPPVVRLNRWPNKPRTLRLNMGKVDPYKSKSTTLPNFNMEPENATLE